MPSRALVLCLLGGLSGCGLGGYPVSDCTDNEACRLAFGLGSVCGEDGYCVQEDPHPRCPNTWPEDLFDRPLGGHREAGHCPF